MPLAATTSSHPGRAIFWGGLACGVLDITQACIAWGIQNHLPPMRIFQSVAAGLLGRSAAQGGLRTAVLGGVLHFFIAFSWAALYYLASRKLAFMAERPVLSGLLYGELVWAVMNFAVIPLSAIHRWPTWTRAFVITGPVGHLFLVGLPIALAVRRWAPLSSDQRYPR
jgi:hypothetical protein